MHFQKLPKGIRKHFGKNIYILPMGDFNVEVWEVHFASSAICVKQKFFLILQFATIVLKMLLSYMFNKRFGKLILKKPVKSPKTY